MKGSLFWIVFWVFVTLIVTLVIIVWQGPALLNLADQAVKLSAKYDAIQIAGAINGLQGAPEGTEYRLDLPKDGDGCVNFTTNSVKVSFRERSSIGLVETSFANANISVTSSIDCRVHKDLVMTRRADHIAIRAE